MFSRFGEGCFISIKEANSFADFGEQGVNVDMEGERAVEPDT